ncbi:DUF6090 family protein [Robiginitalea aurantiaca]|uniref:DUF6090 family protein n=1 Tax=Robiginitalea aurantiaca TaxID=3056915 RepID=A0ABT7WIB5_9FLAO|nr:DUF6090 family protein [Robiginitalea aurantiaca]MDM9632668.1 DUF6090 family protein [Robiginitalea aurantiaca]
MIRFFRQIRHRLITENKFSKYLLYAVGEILLVVIGILIALQVDSWNEDKQNLKVERVFYSDILGDLNKDSLKLEGLTQFYKNRIENAGWLLRKVRTPGSIVDGREIGKHVQPLYLGASSITYNSTYEASKSSGDFAYFRNKDILKNINQYYADFGELSGILTATTRWLETSLEPILSTYPENYITAESGSYVLTSELDDLSELFEFITAIEDTRDLPLEIENILKRPEFENYLTGDLGRSFNALASIERRMQRMEMLKMEIVTYLEELNQQ